MAEDVTPTERGGGVITGSAGASLGSGWAVPQGQANAGLAAPGHRPLGEVHLVPSEVTALTGEVNGWLLDLGKTGHWFITVFLEPPKP